MVVGACFIHAATNFVFSHRTMCDTDAMCDVAEWILGTIRLEHTISTVFVSSIKMYAPTRHGCHIQEPQTSRSPVFVSSRDIALQREANGFLYR